MSARRIAVVSAGLSNPSSTRMLADRLATATIAELAASDITATADVIELRDLAHDITNNLLTGFAPPALESAINSVVSADALIAVTPIFSTSYSGLFKSFIDVLDPDSLTGKPVLIGANAGTARHSLAIDYAIRPLFAYLHAAPVSTGVFAASSDWGSNADEVAPLSARVERGARELAAAVVARTPVTDADPFDPASYLGEGKSFGHLLGGLAGE
ncbi:CE1759 family FMN reductase [Microbacterium arborescens]|uniref:CE1759 family FMN reductase n=1 Tax=Microbacterium arborescens TaxID=33883 RepID=UPI0027873BB6|nr:CE1759 family FMN reductase [Microbacterium arborescens]MDQ1216809.1 FMN reductase [Microbacterium arborescens]